MSWSKEQRTFGVFKIDGKNVKIFGTPISYTTLHVGEDISRVDWNGDNLLVLLKKNGKVRIYKPNGSYTVV